MSITRRGLVVGTAAFAAAAFLPRTVLAQEVAGPFKLDPLPYPANALVPHIDARTMEIHHDFHHRAYVNGLNAAVKDHADVAAMPLQDILGRLAEMPEAIRTALRNFGGGHANHAMFWQVMGSQAMGRQVKGSRPSVRRKKARRKRAPTALRPQAILPLRSTATSAVCANCRTTSTSRACACSATDGCSSPSPRTAN